MNTLRPCPRKSGGTEVASIATTTFAENYPTLLERTWSICGR